MLLNESSLPCTCLAEPMLAPCDPRDVERRRLMRILAVAQIETLAELQRQRVGIFRLRALRRRASR